MSRYKILLLALVLVLIPVGIVGAQSSANYAVQRSIALGGGVSDSANFKVTAVIGQADTDLADSSSYKVSAGFLFPLSNRLEYKTWLPVVVK